jgi:pathogen-inducible salicylic acid glucosyltransferase
MNIWSNFRTIGPSIPYTYLDKQITDEGDYGVEHFKSEEYIEWLNNKPKRSVVYVSFGTMGGLNEEQTEEVANGLKDCGSYFLWVVRTSEETKLPKDFEKKSEKGLVVTWCSQLKVLAHESIGCFLTHCGWSSVIESLQVGCPLIMLPFENEQGLIAKHMEENMVGVKVQRNDEDDGKFTRDSVTKALRSVMVKEEGNSYRSNAEEMSKIVGDIELHQKYLDDFVDHVEQQISACL